MFVPLNMNGEEIQNTPSMKPKIFVLTGKYLNRRLTINTYFLEELRFRYTLSLIVDSVDPGTKHSRSYS